MPVSSWCHETESPGGAEGHPVERILGAEASDCVTRGESLITLLEGAFAMKEIPRTH